MERDKTSKNINELLKLPQNFEESKVYIKELWEDLNKMESEVERLKEENKKMYKDAQWFIDENERILKKWTASVVKLEEENKRLKELIKETAVRFHLYIMTEGKAKLGVDLNELFEQWSNQHNI